MNQTELSLPPSRSIHERVCDTFERLFSELASGTSEYREQRFPNGPGCGLANGIEGAHVAFFDSRGAKVWLTVTPSMIERGRWQYSVARENDSDERDTVLLAIESSTDEAVRHLVSVLRLAPI